MDETKKTVTGTTKELSVSGNKKIETLCQEFNKKFPYLRLSIFDGDAREKVQKGESIIPLDRSKTLGSVRRVDNGGDISIWGNKKIKTLEEEFDKVFGLFCQVCYTTNEGKRYYTTGAADDMTLSAFNKKCEADGCKKDEWK